MRGSPVLRFIFLTLALIAAGFGILRVTSANTRAATTPPPSPPPAIATSSVPYQLLLSAPAAEVKIDTGVVNPPISAEGSRLSGKLELDAANPHLSLSVRWQNPPAVGEHRFAKLTLEAPGITTFTHVFDADGDIDEFLELPLPAVK
ncbi:MAG: hypothetical protein WEB53_08500 [Akkermansiaceae bacterium]